MSQDKKLQVAYNVPITVILEGAGCEWSLDSTAGGGALQYQPAPSTTYMNDDPWALLQRFMLLTTHEEALRFLNETGYFSLTSSAVPIEGQDEAQQGVQAGLFGLDDVLEWSDIFRKLVKNRPTKWGYALTGSEEVGLETSVEPPGFRIVFGGLLDNINFLKALAVVRHTKFSIEFRWGSGKHEAIITARDTLSAFLATVCVIHLKGERYGFCARKDCGELFKWESDHKKKYCCWECGHKVAVRKSRKKALRKAKAQPRPKRSR